MKQKCSARSHRVREDVRFSSRLPPINSLLPLGSAPNSAAIKYHHSRLSEQSLIKELNL